MTMIIASSMPDMNLRDLLLRISDGVQAPPPVGKKTGMPCPTRLSGFCKTVTKLDMGDDRSDIGQVTAAPA